MKTNKKTARRLPEAFLGVCATCLCMLLVVRVTASEPGVEATGWISSVTNAGVTYATDLGAGTATMQFPKVSTGYPPPYLHGETVACVGTDQAPFIGDYTVSGVSGVSIELAQLGSVYPVVGLVVKTEAHDWFNYKLLDPAADGTWRLSNVSLDKAAGWRRDGLNTEAAWLNDLHHVEAIGVVAFPDSAEAHGVAIRNLRLLSADQTATPSAVLAAGILDRFKVGSMEELTDAQRRVDSDGDGMSDYEEIYLAETNPDDAGSVLQLRLDRTETGVEISWDGVPGGEYTVWRSAAPGSAFEAISSTLVGVDHGRMSHMDNTGGGKAMFYRVKKR